MKKTLKSKEIVFIPSTLGNWEINKLLFYKAYKTPHMSLWPVNTAFGVDFNLKADIFK